MQFKKGFIEILQKDLKELLCILIENPLKNN